MNTIHLYGKLRKQFGPSFNFEVSTAAEALRALNCAFPGEFVAALRTGNYKLVRGAKATGMVLDLDRVNDFNLGRADLHLIPAAAGAANGKGIAKTIIGTALIGGAIFMSGGTLAAPLSMLGAPTAIGMSYGNIAVIGLGIALSGVSSLLAAPAGATEAAAASESFAINGPSNIAQQGAPLALIYGEVITGSTCISFDADVEDIGAYQDAAA
ncbi:hypothetical protein [Tardiphaga sp.]|uniref:hypothetical protein n=1 Tax=Tardiphaga sp. TaxID=1926292 RepID=UPI0026298092|nr:hypothetical protein [Tardiphaga sp.]MDB5616159.1 putative phage GP20-related protein [Tardiphaga sp.]